MKKAAHRAKVHCVRWNSTGSRLASASSDKVAAIHTIHLVGSILTSGKKMASLMRREKLRNCTPGKFRHKPKMKPGLGSNMMLVGLQARQNQTNQKKEDTSSSYFSVGLLVSASCCAAATLLSLLEQRNRIKRSHGECGRPGMEPFTSQLPRHRVTRQNCPYLGYKSGGQVCPQD